MASPIPTQLSPGVNVSEIDLSQFIQPEALNSAGMVGTFNWGPSLVTTRVTTESDLASVFGKPTLDASDTLSETDFFAASNFLRYSNNLKVVRILQASDSNATSQDLGITGIANCTYRTIKSPVEFRQLGGFSGQNGIEPLAHFRGKYPGNFGNALKVVVYDGGSGEASTTSTTVPTSAIVDYDLAGGYALTNLIGVSSGTIGYTFTINGEFNSGAASGTPTFPGTDDVSQSIIAVTGGSVGFFTIRFNIPNSTNAPAFVNSLHTSTSPLKFVYATGTTTENYALTGTGTNSSGNRDNNYVLENKDGKAFNPFTSQTISARTNNQIFARAVDLNTAEIIFLNGASANMNPTIKIGNTFTGAGGGSTQTVIAQSYTGFTSSGVPTGFGSLIFNNTSIPSSKKGGSTDLSFDNYRFTISDINEKIFPDGQAPNTSLHGWAKLVGLTGGVTFQKTVDGTPENIGITFDSVGGVDGIRRDFVFGMKQLARDGTIQTTTTSSVEGSNVSLQMFDKSPTTSQYALDNGGSNDEISIAIIDQNGKFGPLGGILERFELLSKATDAKNLDGESIYYMDYINNNSKYVYMTKPFSYVGGASISSKASTAFDDITSQYIGADGITKTAVGRYESQLAFGQSGVSATTPAEQKSAYALFRDDDNAVDILFVPESSVSNDATSGETVIEENVYSDVIEPRKDTILVIPTPKPASTNQHPTQTATNAISFRNGILTVPSNSYTILVAGRKTFFDTFNNQTRKMSLSSDIAGIMSAQEIPWESPAGLARGNLKNVIKLETNFSKADRDELYKNAINFFVAFNDGTGTVLFGDKTLLKKPSAFDRINVRRVFIALEKAIAKAAKYSLFEFNDEFTRSQFRNLAVPYLANVQGQRGIADFKVVCDETNNTSEVIQNNQFVADIYIKPLKSVNFIQLNFIAVRNEFNFNTTE